MNAIQQQIQEHGGAYGTSITGAGVYAWVTAAEPYMKLVSFTLASIVAILTIIWYVKRIWGKGPKD